MSSYWEIAASRTDGQNTAEEFEAAAYRLVTEQVLYHADKFSRVSYWLIDRYTKDFERALEPLGITVEVNTLLRYVYAKPKHTKSNMASVSQTLIALVLRNVYDESVRGGQINDNSEVLCDLVELEEKFRLTTGRELPSKGEFDSAIKQFKRWGIVKPADEESLDDFGGETDAEPQMYIVIRPAIAEVLGENALLRLGQWAQSKSIKDTTNNETEVVEVGV